MQTSVLNAVEHDYLTHCKGKHSIVSLSVGYSNNKTKRKAVERYFKAGIIVLGATGNENMSCELMLYLADHKLEDLYYILP